MYSTELLLQLQFELTKIAVSEFGYLHPNTMVNKTILYFDTNHWSVRDAPMSFRKYLNGEHREPDVTSENLKRLLGGLMECVQREKAVAFINQIEDIYLDTDEETQTEYLCLVFYNKSEQWLLQTVHWFNGCTDFNKWKEYTDLHVSFKTKPRPRRTHEPYGC